MKLYDILDEIHSNHLEVDVYRELSNWMIADRVRLTKQCSESQSTVRTIGKIAFNNSNKTEALTGIKNICYDEYIKATSHDDREDLS